MDVSELRKNLRGQPNRDNLRYSSEHQSRVRFHAVPALESRRTDAERNFEAFVKGLLIPEKQELFFKLWRYPLATNSVVSTAFDRLSRFFTASDANISYTFKEKTYEDDWNWYRDEKLHEPEIWSTEIWERYKSSPNAFLVIDMPVEQDTELPEPYFYFIESDSVSCYEAERGDKISWIAFYRKKKSEIVYIDKEVYSVFKAENGEPSTILSETAHGLGYCPVCFFVSEAIDPSNPLVKASPITCALEKLDWYLFYSISKRNLDLFGSYPILSGYDRECDYRDGDGNTCHNGWLVNPSGDYLRDRAGQLRECPLCRQHKMVGPGTFVKVPAPGDGIPDMRDPVQMLEVDRNSLDYNVDETERLKEDILSCVCGRDNEADAGERKNEAQVMSGYESRESVINRVKRNFEAAEKFVDDTICRLRYGGMFLGSVINYGTRFFHMSADELREQYDAAVKSGSTVSELSVLRSRIIESEFNNDPAKVQRVTTLSDVEPYRDLTLNEVVSLYGKGIATMEDVKVKSMFSDYVSRFERENMDVTEFGSNTDYDTKIKNIKERIYEYAREDLQAAGQGQR